MMLTINETAIVMTAIEGSLVTPRQVYYKLNQFSVLGTKLGRAIRICTGEIEVYYDRTKYRKRAYEITRKFNSKTSSSFFSSKSKNDIPPDFKQAIESVERWTKFKRDKKISKRVYSKKRNYKQLTFEFAA